MKSSKRQGTVLCLDCVFSAVGESEEQRAYYQFMDQYFTPANLSGVIAEREQHS